MKINMDTESVLQTKNKRALSTVIATVLIILLVVVSTTIVWVFVRNIVVSRTHGVDTCFNVEASDKVTINDYYTCYNQTSNEVQFSVSITDAQIDSLIVTILIGGNSRSFTLTNNDTVIQDLAPYKGNYGTPVKLPGTNEGRTYVANFTTEFEQGVGKVDWIKIAPVIEEKQCGASDETYQVEDCGMFED
ncbi:MAG: hypothetical protein NTZ83_04050 [Candidatus Pacearchaeota archaeon]|nr:hypothetical protein [Candidatus Pacearchaeota archaeon]